MNNKEIVKQLRQTAAFMELHGENEFKIRSYNNAIYNIERMTEALENMDLKQLESVNGIGKSIASKIFELTSSGEIKALDDLISNTPDGIAEMMNVKGLGTKKIRTIWQELDILDLDDLQAAIQGGRLSQVKGFGGKVVENMLTSINFYLESKNRIRFDKAEEFCDRIKVDLEAIFSKSEVEATGEVRRKLETISRIEFLIGLSDFVKDRELIDGVKDYDEILTESSPFISNGTWENITIPIRIYFCKKEEFGSKLFETTGSRQYLNLAASDDKSYFQIIGEKQWPTEKDFYDSINKPYISPELREGLLDPSSFNENTELVTVNDLKGILHAHSHYSDGGQSLREMAEFCRDQGYEYFGISDHSKAASFYANGMDEDRVVKQHKEIDELNDELAPFKIFKGIEADILPEGELDYDPETLNSFDFVVASVHSVMNMDLDKAMKRMLKAIENPQTTILGHLTGRQLLIRDGYPLDMPKIIDACAQNGVIIEINSHPNRLDLDWRWVGYALDKGVTLSINPDAHSIDGIQHVKYGVNIGRKGGLTAKDTFNTKSVKEVTDYFLKRKQKAASTLQLSETN